MPTQLTAPAQPSAEPETLPSVAHNRAVIRRVFEEFVNRGDFSVVDEVYREDMIDHEPMPGAPEGRIGVKYTIAGLREAFPDLKVTIEDMSAEGDFVVIHNTWRGTHLGTLLGLEATGRAIESRGIVIWRFQDGLIAERWAHGVASNMLAELGMKMPGARKKARQRQGAEPVVRTVPIRNGKPWAWHRLTAELQGPRLREYEASRRRLGITHETLRLDPRPDRDHVIVTFETADADRTAKRWASSEDPFDLWLRDQVLDIHGEDPWAAPGSAPGSSPGLTWTAPPPAAPRT
ncbi:ester cyclase [Streptomyces sp. NPDC059037]|uniref:ester cyclase n=1 Tax=Streptomyces sp. NPDC059037 TaxID=3346710 RepID=UPI003696E6AE